MYEWVALSNTHNASIHPLEERKYHESLSMQTMTPPNKRKRGRGQFSRFYPIHICIHLWMAANDTSYHAAWWTAHFTLGLDTHWNVCECGVIVLLSLVGSHTGNYPVQTVVILCELLEFICKVCVDLTKFCMIFGWKWFNNAFERRSWKTTCLVSTISSVMKTCEKWQ